MSYKKSILLILVFILTLFNCFWRLGTTEIQEWDEARRGISALEMIKSGSYTINTYRGEPDYWSVKPPLGLWLIAGSYKINGISRLSLRLPAAISALLTTLLVILIGYKLRGSQYSLLAGIILATSPPFILTHSARAGEYDAPLALLYLCALAVFIFKTPRVSRNILLAVFCGLVLLLKSFALVPLLVLCFFAIKQNSPSWKSTIRETTTIALGALVVASPWILSRYSFDQLKFFSMMFSTDLTQRTTSGIEGHNRHVLWYLYRLGTQHTAWIIISLLALLLIRKQFKKLTPSLLQRFYCTPDTLVAFWAIVPLLIASALSTKLPWYINPIYPPLALLIAAPISKLLEKRRAVGAVLIVLGLIVTEIQIVKKILKQSVVRPADILIEKSAIPSGTIVYAKNWHQRELYLAAVEKSWICKEASHEAVANVTDDSYFFDQEKLTLEAL